MHRWRKLDNGGELLLTGADNKAFPIPLKKNAAGQWSFDVEAGKKEILARRIGRNELAAIDVRATIASAQLEYYAQRHDGTQQFAQKFISDEESKTACTGNRRMRNLEARWGHWLHSLPARATTSSRTPINLFMAISSVCSTNKDLMRKAGRRITLSTAR